MSQTKVQLINNVIGNSGIGTASPQRTLEVVGQLAVGNASTAHWFFDRNDSNGLLEFTQSNSSANDGVKMVISTDGKVGIGDLNPDALLHVGTNTNSDGTNVEIHIGGNSTNTRKSMIKKLIQSDDRALQIHAATGSSDEEIRFFSDNTTERYRVGADGTFRSNGTLSSLQGDGIALEDTSNGGRLYIGRGNNDMVAEFQRSGTRVGSISINASNTFYNTSSDYRLKENVVAISDGITRLKTLKPSRFNFKVDTDTTVDGFLAHEVTSVVPEAITGTKDEVDSDNNPVYQGIDQSRLVPLLTAALQEEIAKREALESRVATLEAA